MAQGNFRALGVIVSPDDYDRVLGYAVIPAKTDLPSITPLTNAQVVDLISKGRLVNLAIDGDKIISTECSISRLSKFDTSGVLVQDGGQMIVSRIKSASDETLGFKIVSPRCELRSVKVDNLITKVLNNEVILVNAKLRELNGNHHISAIKGEFESEYLQSAVQQPSKAWKFGAGVSEVAEPTGDNEIMTAYDDMVDGEYPEGYTSQPHFKRHFLNKVKHDVFLNALRDLNPRYRAFQIYSNEFLFVMYPELKNRFDSLSDNEKNWAVVLTALDSLIDCNGVVSERLSNIIEHPKYNKRTIHGVKRCKEWTYTRGEKPQQVLREYPHILDTPSGFVYELLGLLKNSDDLKVVVDEFTRIRTGKDHNGDIGYRKVSKKDMETYQASNLHPVVLSILGRLENNTVKRVTQRVTYSTTDFNYEAPSAMVELGITLDKLAIGTKADSRVYGYEKDGKGVKLRYPVPERLWGTETEVEILKRIRVYGDAEITRTIFEAYDFSSEYAKEMNNRVKVINFAMYVLAIHNRELANVIEEALGLVKSGILKFDFYGFLPYVDKKAADILFYKSGMKFGFRDTLSQGVSWAGTASSVIPQKTLDGFIGTMNINVYFKYPVVPRLSLSWNTEHYIIFEED